MLSMSNQGSEPMAAVDPNSMEKRSGDEVSQGHAPVISGHYSWPSSSGQVSVSWNYGANCGPLENSTSSSLVHHYDPLRDSTGSDIAQVIINSAPQISASSNLSATTGSQSFAGYVPYSSSTYAYGYDNMQYQSNYYGHPQQGSYTSYQQGGASQNSGASYPPHSSFQNTGSYATPTSYSGAYFASDHQTAAGYPTSGYFNQTNYWNDESGGYPLQYSNYPSSDTNSTPSTSNATTSSYPYQQESNQWSMHYGASVPNGNYTPGSGNTVASTVPTATYPAHSGNGGTLYASIQPPPPGTTSWREDLGPTLPSSQVRNDVICRFPSSRWDEKAPTVQSYHLNQIPSDLQKTSDLKLPLYENHDESGKTTCSYDLSSSSQVFSTGQVFQNSQQPLQTFSATDAYRASKMQIPTNPRITSSLAVGIPKADKEASTTNAVAKPAYISVQVPKLNNQLSTDDADTVIKHGAFPPSVRAYVERCFSRCKDDTQRVANKLILSEIIAKAKEDGTLWTKNWDMEPLFPLPNSNSNSADQKILQSTVPSTPKLPSRRSKSRWEPVAEEILDVKVAQANHDSTKIVSWAERMAGSRKLEIMDNVHSMKFTLPQQSLLNKTSQRPLKKSRFSDTLNIAENGNSSTDSDKEQELTKHYSSAIALENSPEEKKRREHRSKRFENGQDKKAVTKQLKSEGVGVENIYLRRDNAMLLSKSYDDQCRAVEDIYWDALTVKGSCQEVEKRYLRLTSAPDPSTVRPEEVLEKALYMVQTSQKNYLYKCDQLKAIRQDLTVQRIQNELTVKVYETHGRLALEAGDLPEFNQCQSQLKRLYAEGIRGCQMEFSAYNLLCVILHSNNKRDLLSSINSLSNEAKQDEAVKHALAVHSAVSSGNYVLFFRLYKAASSLISCLMDLHVEKMRFEAMKCISKSYRPTVPVTYIARVLGFSTSVQTGVDDGNDANGLEECEEWLRAHGAALIVENNAELQLDTKASSSALYMPESEVGVSHGDANLAVDDFLTRT